MKPRSRVSHRRVKKFIRSMFPKAGNGTIEFLIWEKTAFPFVGWRECRKQIREYHAALILFPNTRLCDFCNCPASGWVCEQCAKGLAA